MLRHTDLNICHYSGIFFCRIPSLKCFLLAVRVSVQRKPGKSVWIFWHAWHATFIRPENHGQKTEKNIPNHLRAPLIGALGAHEGLAHPGADINPLQFVAVLLSIWIGDHRGTKEKNTFYFGVIWVGMLTCQNQKPAVKMFRLLESHLRKIDGFKITMLSWWNIGSRSDPQVFRTSTNYCAVFCGATLLAIMSCFQYLNEVSLVGTWATRDWIGITFTFWFLSCWSVFVVLTH